MGFGGCPVREEKGGDDQTARLRLHSRRAASPRLARPLLQSSVRPSPCPCVCVSLSPYLPPSHSFPHAYVSTSSRFRLIRSALRMLCALGFLARDDCRFGREPRFSLFRSRFPPILTWMGGRGCCRVSERGFVAARKRALSQSQSPAGPAGSR